MSLTIDQIYNEALLLPDESKATLAERIVEYLETHTDGNLERLCLDTAIAKRQRGYR